MSSTKKVWLFLSLILVLAGCAGASPASSGSKSAESAHGAPEGPGGGGRIALESSGRSSGADSAPAQAAPSSASEERSARAPSPESRPGLGTEWGETRTSRVHDVSFVRESGRPFAVAALHYNDRRGALAMASQRGARDFRRDVTTGGGAVTIAIRDESGNPLEAINTGDRTLVVGEAGQRYSIVLTNRTSHRFESVVTVDGLDVINGKAGTAENRGYVLLPFATLEIEGFRQSSAAVAAFRFAAVADSYAAQTGAARNVGVIGVAFFGERGDTFVSQSELDLRDSASPFPADPRFAQPPRR